MRSSIRVASSKKRMLFLSFLILLLCLSIGYAALSQSIKLNIVANVDKMTWDVHLENVVIRSGSVSAIPPVISSDKTSVSLTVTLSQPNEYYEYYVDVVNNGSINAQVDSVFKSSLTTEQAKYIDYKITYKDGVEINRDDLLNAGEKETLKVLVYIEDLHESLYSTINETLTLEGKINYIQKNSNGVERNKNSLYEEIKKQTQSDSAINFGAISSDTNGKGVYTLSQTRTYAYPVYYYRGDVQNNNVIFANFCWKMLRTTTTGGIKLVYNGIPNDGICNATGEATEIGKSVFNIENNDEKYVGYMYDNNTNDSAIKTKVDAWFTDNLLAYQSYLEDVPFYNERDYVVSENILRVYAPRNRVWGNDTNVNDYLVTVPNTTIKLGATNIEDIFTVSSDLGNGKLTYPVGLLTTDEAILAGGRAWASNTDTGENTSYYLYTGTSYWTLSPVGFYSGNKSHMFHITADGIVDNSYSSYNYGVRPVISLKKNIIYSIGDGSANQPYIIAQ